MEDDHLLVAQDGESRVTIVNVQGQTDAFTLCHDVQAATKDITFKIEEPIGEGIDIKNEFGVRGNDDGPCNAKDSDDSDHAVAGTVDQKFIEYDSPIEAIFTARSSTE